MGALLVIFSGDLSSWLLLGSWQRAFRLSELIVAAIAVYFGALLLLGVRARDLRPQRSDAV
jgi:peptidoglycan biosynthesis protein MviN/MurJ (putative lipid II flippase)